MSVELASVGQVSLESVSLEPVSLEPVCRDPDSLDSRASSAAESRHQTVSQRCTASSTSAAGRRWYR